MITVSGTPGTQGDVSGPMDVHTKPPTPIDAGNVMVAGPEGTMADPLEKSITNMAAIS
jgi:hypothetical protein